MYNMIRNRVREVPSILVGKLRGILNWTDKRFSGRGRSQTKKNDFYILPLVTDSQEWWVKSFVVCLFFLWLPTSMHTILRLYVFSRSYIDILQTLSIHNHFRRSGKYHSWNILEMIIKPPQKPFHTKRFVSFVACDAGTLGRSTGFAFIARVAASTARFSRRHC